MIFIKFQLKPNSLIKVWLLINISALLINMLCMTIFGPYLINIFESWFMYLCCDDKYNYNTYKE